MSIIRYCRGQPNVLQKMRILRFTLLFFFPLLVTGGFWSAGIFLSKPVPAVVGICPGDLICEDVEFSSDSGSKIKGWFSRGRAGRGAVVLMHGLRSNRLALVERMRFLSRSGFSVLAFDFQGSGESPGEQLTFGYLESRDAAASIKFIRQKLPNEKVGVVGISMGGAAFLLQTTERADALILEMVYPTLQKAIENRLNLWLFDGAEILSPMLTLQLPLRLGVSVNELRPVDHLKQINCPTFFIVGENDRHTTLEESKQFYEDADQPKEIWIVPGAEHGDLHRNSPQQYEERVIGFFERSLES